jgi:MinD-like ATPase involved in chromosome partitioning or flagellar assembly
LPRIISTHSFRGGTGKSNLTANLSVMIARKGHRVGVIDTDIQSPGIHVIFQLDEEAIRYSLNDYLWGRCKISEAAYDVTERSIGAADPDSARPRVFLIPSSLRTGEIARILREGYDVGKLNDGLQDAIKQLDLDYLLIDTHPGVNEETLLSLAISDALVLILRPDRQDLQGTAVAIELARRLDVPKMLLVANKVPPDTDVSGMKQQIEMLFSTPVVATLPLSNDIARLASSSIFCNRFPSHPFTEELRKVADLLMQ